MRYRKMTPTFIKLELESFTTERLDRLKQQLTLIAIEDDLLVFRVDKKWFVIYAEIGLIE